MKPKAYGATHVDTVEYTIRIDFDLLTWSVDLTMSWASTELAVQRYENRTVYPAKAAKVSQQLHIA